MLAAVLGTVIAALIAVPAGWQSPLEAPAEWLMEWTPVPIANALLLDLGPVARPAALLGALALVMLLGGVSGMLTGVVWGALWERGAVFALAGLALLVLFQLLFAPLQQAPVVWLALVYAIVLVVRRPSPPSPLSHGRDWGSEGAPDGGARGSEGAPDGGARGSEGAPDGGARGPRGEGTRRRFLEQSGVILGGAAALVGLFSLKPVLFLAPVRRLLRYSPPTGLRVPGLAALVTPAGQFYRTDRVLEAPVIGLHDWRLVVDGVVDRRLELDFQGLRSLSPEHRAITLECVDNPVGGPLIGNALWTGVPLFRLLRMAGAHGNALVFHAADGYREDAPRGAVEGAGAMVAYGMNGETLSRIHGYPARLVLPGVYGFKSLKWLTRVEVTDTAQGGDWLVHGWTDIGLIHTTTRIDVARRQGGAVLLAGIAFAGARGVRAVEVRVDRRPWQRARLGPALSPQSWVQWVVRLPADRGSRVEARAIDGMGRVQTAARHDSYPKGATGWATVTV